MKKIIEIEINKVIPDKVDVLGHQGIPSNAEVSNVILDLLNEAYKLFEKSAAPVCMIAELSIDDFEKIYQGEGENADDDILHNIYPDSEYLALFALTMGKKVSDKINNLFAENDYPLASMLDSVASIAADTAVEFMEKYFFNELKKNQLVKNETRALSYSPGYCGWDISGQKKLFNFLNPELIGITLNPSYLMSPIKSVSGVIIAGDREIHMFDMGYSYCSYCKTQSCLERMEKL